MLEEAKSLRPQSGNRGTVCRQRLVMFRNRRATKKPGVQGPMSEGDEGQAGQAERENLDQVHRANRSSFRST